MAAKQSTAEAFEAHLQAITRALDLQASLVRSALDLHPVPSLVGFKAAEASISKLHAAVGDLRSDLIAVTTAAGSAEPPTTTAVDALASKAYPSSATMAASIADLDPRHQTSSESFTASEAYPSCALTPIGGLDSRRQSSSAASRSSGASQSGRRSRRVPAVDEEEVDVTPMTADSRVRNSRPSDSLSGVAECLERGPYDNLRLFSHDSVDTKFLNRASVTSCNGAAFRHNGPCIDGSLNPDWSPRLSWDMLVMLLVLCDCVVLPVQLAEFITDAGFDAFWLWLTVTVFLCDLALNFFTGYHAGKKEEHLQEGTLVTDKGSIAMHYLRGWFWVDFLSAVPWSIIAAAFNSNGESGPSSAGQVTKLAKIVKLTRLLRLMRMLRLYKVSVVWERIEWRIGSITALNGVSLLKVLCVWTAICHWGACVWWMVGKRDSLVMLLTMQDDVPEGLHWTELPRRHSAYDDFGDWRWVDKEKSEQYVFCFYWILGVMRTMPAEVTPVNLVERIFVLLFMFFAVMAFAVNVTRLTQAWFRFTARKDQFKEEMACVRMHLNTVNCGNALQLRTQAFLKHLFERRKIHAKELGLLNTLPEELKRKLNHAQRIHYLRMIPCLREWQDQALQQVCDHSTEVVDHLPGDKLTIKNHDAEAAYVLMRGGLQIVNKSHNRLSDDSSCTGMLSTLWRMSVNSNQSFERLTIVDEHCLAQTAVSRDTVVVLECSEVLRIDRRLFREALQSLRARHQQAQERYRAAELAMMRNSVGTFDSSSSMLGALPGVECGGSQARVAGQSNVSKGSIMSGASSASGARVLQEEEEAERAVYHAESERPRGFWPGTAPARVM